MYLIIISYANNVEINVPVTPDATNPKIRTSMGSATYRPENDSIVWKVRSFPGNKVCMTVFQLSTSDTTIDCSVTISLQISTSLGVPLKSGIHTSEFKFWRSSSWAKGASACQIWDTVFHHLRNSGLHYLPLLVAPIYKYDFEFIENNESIFDVLLGEVLKGYWEKWISGYAMG